MQAPLIWDTMEGCSALTGLPSWHMGSLVPCTCGAQQVSRVALLHIGASHDNRQLGPSLLDIICAACTETCSTCRSPARQHLCGLPHVET